MNENIKIGIKCLSETAKLPVFAHQYDACADIHSDEDVLIQPGKIGLISTGIAMQVPIGYECQVRPRSGLAINHGLTVVNSPGTIDAGYRGEVKIILQNTGDQEFMVEQGMRIAQLAIRKIPSIKFEEVDDLNDTDRSTGGFGSTGTT